MCVYTTPGIVRYIEQQHQQWASIQRSTSPNQGGGATDHQLPKHTKSSQKSPQDSLSNSLEMLPSTAPNLPTVVSVIKLYNLFRNSSMQNTSQASQLVNLFAYFIIIG